MGVGNREWVMGNGDGESGSGAWRAARRGRIGNGEWGMGESGGGNWGVGNGAWEWVMRMGHGGWGIGNGRGERRGGEGRERGSGGEG